jgi:hypothetical protein
MNASGLMLAGLGMAALGGILTAVTHSSADNGGTYYVFTGLLVLGGINFLRGLYYYMRERHL